MAHFAYERLSGLDQLFLLFESPTTPMHVGATAIFESGALRTAEGGIDAARIKAYVNTRLERVPRYRQRVAYVPVAAQAVWVDDAQFDLDYHVRHTSLPKPGTEQQLKRLSARIMAQPLDLNRPLWEMWTVEGLEDDRFAMIYKTHHAMIDGISGGDVLALVLSATTETEFEAAGRWLPRRPPSRLQLLRDEIVERASSPLAFGSRLLRHPFATGRSVGGALSAAAEALGNGMLPASPAPFNQPIGSHRRFDWTAMPLVALKQVKDVLGGTVNDVALATVSGAVRRFLLRRGVGVKDLAFRVFVPVSIRPAAERGTLGNQVTGWIMELPIGEADARQRYTAVCNTTNRLKKTDPSGGAQIMTQVAEWTSRPVLNLTARLVSKVLPFNLVVTNVPGPSAPLYLLGSRMTATYPLVPLYHNLGLGIALFSNAGQLYWGCNADWDVMPDLEEFVTELKAAFGELQAIAQPSETRAEQARAAVRRAQPSSQATGGRSRVPRAPLGSVAALSRGNGKRSMALPSAAGANGPASH